MGIRGIGGTGLLGDEDLRDFREFKPVAWRNPNLSRASKVIAFIEGLKITSGMLAGQQAETVAEESHPRHLWGEQ
jgi:hypothetical protein